MSRITGRMDLPRGNFEVQELEIRGARPYFTWVPRAGNGLLGAFTAYGSSWTGSFPRVHL